MSDGKGRHLKESLMQLEVKELYLIIDMKIKNNGVNFNFDYYRKQMEEQEKECQADFLEEQYSLLSYKIHELGSKSKLNLRQSFCSETATKASNLNSSTQKDHYLLKNSTADYNNTAIHPSILNNRRSPSSLSFQTQTNDSYLIDLTEPALKYRQNTQISQNYERNNQRVHSPIRNSRFMNHQQRTYTWVEHKNSLGSSKGSYRAGRLLAPKALQRLSEEHSPINERDRRRQRVKFLKKAHNLNSRRSSVFEHKILSCYDISGEGAIVFQDGSIVIGNWLQGSPVGLVTIRYPDRSIYQGEICDFQPHGFGTLNDSNGARYTGQFCLGQPHGEGTYHHQNGQIIFTGLWKRGVFYG